MSRIGKKPIEIPPIVALTIEGNAVKAKGPKGENRVEFLSDVKVEQKDGKLIVSLSKEGNSFALWGLTRALLQNLILGVQNGFEKKLEIKGVGFKAALAGSAQLKLEVGFSHDILLDIPKGIAVAVEKDLITVSGIDKQQVGQFAATIRAVKPPEPYKGKGIRYLGEKVRRKEGKKAAAAK